MLTPVYPLYPAAKLHNCLPCSFVVVAMPAGAAAPSVDYSRVMWHLPYVHLGAIAHVQFEESFLRLTGRKPQNVPPSAHTSPAAEITLGFDSLPTILGIMNLAVTLDDLRDTAKYFAVPSEGDTIAKGSVYDMRFNWEGIVRCYDSLLPAQNALISKFLGLFNLLDVDAKEAIRLSELRHTLCRLGTAPLTDAEYNHMLYRHRLLHRSTISVFEFLRLVLDVPMEPIYDALQSVEPQPEAAAAAQPVV